MKTFKQFTEETLSLDTSNHSMHFSRDAALNHAKKLHVAGFKGIQYHVKSSDSIGDLHIITHKGNDQIKEDGMAVAGPANVVGTGKIAGSGGLGGEPGVNPKKKKGPVLITMARRKPTQ
jgi:hypothetical protein